MSAAKREREVKDFRHEEARRKNNPPAGIAPTYEVRERRTTRYAYDPHLDPQLVWAGKAEHTSFEVDVVSLHIHERISSRAILEAIKKPEPQFSLFGETPLPADQQIEFYQHEVGWANRLILGDSLLVMNSLLVKEGMAGKVQMIYMDPPYGIKYASNFQPRIDRRDVKDRDEDLTHEPEQIKAYRDTWKLGIHSYLTYLRDRLLLARELLTESGSIFVQINDENLHLVRCLLDEVFGRENFVSVITFTKAPGGLEAVGRISTRTDYLIWYAKDRSKIKYRPIFEKRSMIDAIESGFNMIQLENDTPRPLTSKERRIDQPLPSDARLCMSIDMTKPGPGSRYEIEFQGATYNSGRRWWGTTKESMERLIKSGRVITTGKKLRFIKYLQNFPFKALSNLWDGLAGPSNPVYAVQTNPKVIERCILMTTDPGDLVFDPTCGSGTTAYCAEKWGRRWITCDTSRVALAIARQRLMTAKFDYYELRDPERGPAGGFIYETVPHITLKSIAQNEEIDEIAAKYQPQIKEALSNLNRALGQGWKEWEVPRLRPHPLWPPEVQQAWAFLQEKRQEQRALQEASPNVQEALNILNAYLGEKYTLSDLPESVPGEDWPKEAQEAIRRFWELKQAKRREIDESIQRNAPQETLYDRPKVKRGVVRVSGPFTVEAIPVPAVEDPTQTPIPKFEEEVHTRISDRGGNFLTTLLNLLKQQGGILFPGGRKMELQNLRPLNIGMLHAEGETQRDGKTLRVAISFGPQHGPVTAFQVQEAIPTARMNAYDVLIFAGFSFDPEAQALIQKAPVPAHPMCWWARNQASPF